jgi:hypothetical protein
MYTINTLKVIEIRVKYEKERFYVEIKSFQ